MGPATSWPPCSQESAVVINICPIFSTRSICPLNCRATPKMKLCCALSDFGDQPSPATALAVAPKRSTRAKAPGAIFTAGVSRRNRASPISVLLPSVVQSRRGREPIPSTSTREARNAGARQERIEAMASPPPSAGLSSKYTPQGSTCGKRCTRGKGYRPGSPDGDRLDRLGREAKKSL